VDGRAAGHHDRQPGPGGGRERAQLVRAQPVGVVDDHEAARRQRGEVGQLGRWLDPYDGA
jgi:hypothetical protein